LRRRAQQRDLRVLRIGLPCGPPVESCSRSLVTRCVS
jgi:hypothetical protein